MPKLDAKSAYPVILVGAAVAFFFTQGLPLWNDDYSQWLAQAQSGVLALLGRVLWPITAEPQAWGYSDRPVQVLIYKALYALFGNWGTGYFFFKSLGFGVLCWVMWQWMRRLGVSRSISWLTLGLFALSANTTASMTWLSDFGVLSQGLLAWLLLESVSELRSLTPSSPRFRRLAAWFFCIVYFGTKLKGDLRLAPLVLGAHLFIYDRKRFRSLGPWLGATLVVTLPWSVEMFRHLPPFWGGQGYSGWTYGRFSLARVLKFFAGDALSWNTAPVSMLGGLGLLSCVAVAAIALQRLSQDRLRAAGRETGLLWIWLGVALLALGTVSAQNPTFEVRYALVPLVPAVLLLAHLLEAVRRDFARVRWFQPALFGLLVIQCGLQARHSIQFRRDMGHAVTAIDGLYSTVESRYPGSRFVLGPGFINYPFRESAAHAVRDRRAVGDVGGLALFSDRDILMGSWDSSLDTRFAVEATISGCGAALFDQLFPCGPAEGALLFRYVGQVAEVAQADALDKRHDLRGARDLLENYWKRVPGNHGVAFILGLYEYRLSDFAAMERVYDSFAPYFPTHPSVIYNWALAKAGVQKLSDASRLFERAYSLAPGDYGIGFNLADTYYRLGKRSRALATVNELLRAYPQNEALSRAKQQYSSRGP